MPTTSLRDQANNVAGVVTVQPSAIHDSIQRNVTASLAHADPGTTMAVLTLHTHTGVNLAIAHKFNDSWKVVTWVGKSGWDKPLKEDGAGGVSFTYSR